MLIIVLLAHITVLPFSRGFATAGPATTSQTTIQQSAVRTNSNNRSPAPNGNRARTAAVASKSARFAASVAWRTGEEQASLFSRLLFRYATPLLKTASQRRLDVDDAFSIPDDRKMDRSVASLTRIYSHLRSRKRHQLEEQKLPDHDADEITTSESIILTKALLLHQRRQLLYTGCLRLLNTAIQAFPALLVSRLLRLVEAGGAQPPIKALTSAIALVAVLSVKMITENQLFHNVIKSSTDVRGALAGLIFDKSLRLPGGGSGIARPPDSSGKIAGSGGTAGTTTTPSEGSLGVGGVLNLMQSDTGIIESAALQIHTIWDGPLQIAIYTTLLYRYLGPSVFWGIGVLLLTIPVNSITLRLLNRLAKFENEAKDSRTKRTAESINNMKLLKLQGWENEFANDIRKSRSEELRRHVARGVIRALNTAFSNAVPALVLVVTLTAYVKTGQPLVASTIFTAISLFNQLRFPLFFYPMLIDSLANGKNAMRRIAYFLSSEEIAPYVHHLPVTSAGGGSIEMKNGNFLWTKAKNATSTTASNTAPALIDAELRVNPGEIVAVVGGTGSGKTALIKGLLGELNASPRAIVAEAISEELTVASNETDIVAQPSVVTTGNVAYCSQEAWLPKGTIRDAIIFGRDYDEDRYLAAIRDAGLDKDISDPQLAGTAATQDGQLSHETDVGEGGSSLSGGKQRRGISHLSSRML